MATNGLRMTAAAPPNDFTRDCRSFKLVPLKNMKDSEPTRSKNDSVLSGQLSRLNLFSVLQVLANNKTTGNLVIRTGYQTGFI